MGQGCRLSYKLNTEIQDYKEQVLALNQVIFW